MNRKAVIVVIAVVGLAAAGAGAYYTGAVPVAGGGTGDDIESFPTETATESGGGGQSGPTDGGEATSPFSFVIESIEECGTTCRDVTVTLTNQQDETASDVTVYTRIYAGNSTAEEDRIWQGKEEVGSLAADESTTHTERVSLSLQEGMAVQQEGWITVVTTVETDERTVTFTDERQVA